MDWTPEEVARLLAERPNQPHYIADLVRKAIARETAALQSRIDALTADADRWRFVRSAGKLPVRCTAGYYYEDGVLHPTPEAAIDAARQQEADRADK